MSDETQAPEVEAEAREMGWLPQEDFKGNPEKWIPADQYVERGKNLMPILQATNKRLKDQITSLTSQQAEIKSALDASRETISALQTYHEEDVKQKVEQARKDLKEQLKVASEAGDHESVANLTEEMTRLNTAEADHKKIDEKASVREPQDYTKHPDFIAWHQDNPWYGTDLVRTGVANMAMYKLRQEGNRNVGRTFLNDISGRVETEVAKLSGGRKPPQSKVDGGGETRRSGPVESNGKGYRDLPTAAKEACGSFTKQLVGPNRAYKTEADWQAAYAKRYFERV